MAKTKTVYWNIKTKLMLSTLQNDSEMTSSTFNKLMNPKSISETKFICSFIDGGNQSTLRKSPTCRKSLTNLSHNVVSNTPSIITEILLNAITPVTPSNQTALKLTLHMFESDLQPQKGLFRSIMSDN
jgi:hypothetical protein